MSDCDVERAGNFTEEDVAAYFKEIDKEFKRLWDKRPFLLEDMTDKQLAHQWFVDGWKIGKGGHI